MGFLLLYTLARPPTSFSLRTTYRSFLYASSCLWIQLSTFLSEPHPILSYIFDLPFPAPTTSSSCADLPVSPSVALLCFLYRLLICLFRKYFHRRLSPGLGTDSTDFVTGVFISEHLGFVFSFLHYSFCFLVGSMWPVADKADYPSAFGRTEI